LTEESRQQRDLDWCIQQPALISADDSWPSDKWFANQPAIKLSDLEPPPARFRLGIHFEKLFQCWLTAHPDYAILAANLQIQGEGRTLGEFDLLVDAAGEHEHWELAIKFYINQSSPKDAASWFGPDPADTLASKLDRLLTHQLPLAARPEATARLESLGIQVKQSRSIMKGRLYHPWEAFEAKQFDVPNQVNPTHLRGWWLSLERINQLDGQRLVYLDKRLWLAELNQADEEPQLSMQQAAAKAIASKQIALQFALVDAGGNEQSRGFILKPEWFRLAKR
jgi:hypothetical protein